MRVVRQHHLFDLPRRRDVIRLQIIQPVPWMPARSSPQRQHQASGCSEGGNAAPGASRRRLLHGAQITLQGLVILARQKARRPLTQAPHCLGLGIGAAMGRVGQQPALELGALGQLRLLIDPAQPVQGGLFVLGGDFTHGAFPGMRVLAGGSATLALHASRARIICFSTAL
ncbi:hypothetical protein D3C80_1127630 [compost metagenome]